MLSEFPSELLEAISLVAASSNESRFQNCLRIGYILDSRRSRQVQRSPSSRISGNSANRGLIQKYPCFRRSDGNDGNPIDFQFRVSRRLCDLPGSFFMSCCVGVAMNEENIEFGFRGKYNSYLSFQHRASTFPGITDIGKRNRCPHYLRCAAMRQELPEVRYQRPVRSSLAQEEKSSRTIVHAN